MTSAYETVTGYVGDFLSAGKNIVGAIADGIKGAMSKVTGAMSDLAGKVRDMLPFSPAKDGPLKDIMKTNIAGSIAKTIDKDEGDAVGAMAGMMGALDDEMSVADLVGNINGSVNSQVDHNINDNMASEKQPISISIDGDSEWIRAYVNKQNAVDAKVRRF